MLSRTTCVPRRSRVTGPPRAITRQRAIATTNKAKRTPLRPPTTQSGPPSPKENKPASDTSRHVHRSKAAGPGAAAGAGLSPQLACRRSWPRRAAPLLRAPAAPIQVASRTWPRCPRKQQRRRCRRAGGPGARAPSGFGARGGCAPSPAARDCGVSSPGSRPCLRAKGSDLVSQQSLLVTTTQLEAKSGGAGRERARGRWPATRAPAGLTSVLTPGTWGGGTGPPKSKSKMGNGEARAALRSLGVWGKSCSGFQEFEPVVASFSLSLFSASVPRG